MMTQVPTTAMLGRKYALSPPNATCMLIYFLQLYPDLRNLASSSSPLRSSHNRCRDTAVPRFSEPRRTHPATAGKRRASSGAPVPTFGSQSPSYPATCQRSESGHPVPTISPSRSQDVRDGPSSRATPGTLLKQSPPGSKRSAVRSPSGPTPRKTSRSVETALTNITDERIPEDPPSENTGLGSLFQLLEKQFNSSFELRIYPSLTRVEGLKDGVFLMDHQVDSRPVMHMMEMLYSGGIQADAMGYVLIF